MELSQVEKIIKEQGIKEGDVVEMDIDEHNSSFPAYRHRRIGYVETFRYKLGLEQGDRAIDFKAGDFPDILFYVDTRKNVPGFGMSFNCGDNNCGRAYSAKKDILDLKKYGARL
jgi:hypothetical protein